MDVKAASFEERLRSTRSTRMRTELNSQPRRPAPAAARIEADPMATLRQILANRRNAAFCCGPKTEAGKARSRLNALRHGLAAQRLRQTTPEAEQLAQALVEEYGEESIALAKEAAEAEIDIMRVRQLQASIVDRIPDVASASPADDPTPELVAQLARLDRYQGHAFAKRQKALRAMEDAFWDTIMDRNWFRSAKNRLRYQKKGLPVSRPPRSA